MNANELVHQAVELAVERNPRLIVEPYYQMKAAATILADQLKESESLLQELHDLVKHNHPLLLTTGHEARITSRVARYVTA